MGYLIHYLIFSGIYIILSLSLNLLVGYTGILSMAQAAMFGIGAYTAALLAVNFELSFILVMLLAVVIGAVASLIISGPALRVSGDYFIVASFGMQFLLYDIFRNWDAVTRGPAGIPGIPKPSLFGVKMVSDTSFLILTVVAVGLVIMLVWWLSRSPFGRILRGIRESETAVQALGKNIVAVKVIVTAIACGLAGLAGSLYAYYIRVIDPYSFTVHESIYILTLMIVGGSGTITGSIVGPLVLLAIPELLSLLAIPSTVVAPLRQLLYGGLLIAFMFFRPQGLLGEKPMMLRLGPVSQEASVPAKATETVGGGQ